MHSRQVEVPPQASTPQDKSEPTGSRSSEGAPCDSCQSCRRDSTPEALAGSSAALKSRIGALFEHQLLIHIEHLFSISVNTGERDGKQSHERNGAQRLVQRPMFHLGQIFSKYEKAEQVRHQNDPGVAFKWGIRTRERDFPKSYQEDFNEQHDRRSEDRSVEKGASPAEENPGGHKARGN